jgi:erythromycin esterase-like protein
MNTPEMESALKGYDRWPSSMWGNYDMLSFLLWVNQYNNEHTSKVSYYGLDLYSFWEWATEMHLKEGEYFSRYNNDAQLYAADPYAYPRGQRIARNLFDSLMKHTGINVPESEEKFKLYQQAWLFLEGEHFFRIMKTDRVTAVNTRDRFMAETAERLLKFYGKDAKLIAWVHNGHSGDAQYSSMHNAGYTSTAEILKNELGKENIYSVGFGTYKGKVLAGYRWNEPLTEQTVLPAKKDTWEEILHRQNDADKIVFSKDLLGNPKWDKWTEFRSIGASFDGAAIYSQSVIPRRFDAFIFIDSTTAVKSVK